MDFTAIENAFGVKEAEERIDKQIAEKPYYRRVLIINPLNRLKPTSRKVHKKGRQYWVRFNNCRCWIIGGVETRIENADGSGFSSTSFSIGY